MMDSALFDAMVLHIRNGASQTRAGTDKLRKHVDALIADRDALREQVAALEKQVAGQKALVEMTRHSGDSAREQEWALRQALESVEWVWTMQDDGDIIATCPWCKGTTAVCAAEEWVGIGHAPDCQRQAALD